MSLDPIPTQLRKEVNDLFPTLHQPELLDLLLSSATYLELDSGVELLHTGSPITDVPLVLSGQIKVTRQEARGREVLLYYILPGDTCALTLSAFLKREASPVRAVTQQPTRLLLLPPNAVFSLHRHFPDWTQFMVQTYTRRLEDLLEVVDSIAFRQMDRRLVEYLREKSRLHQTHTLHTSHIEISRDLGTRREVVSRLLKQLEKKNLVEIRRGRLRLLPAFFAHQP